MQRKTIYSFVLVSIIRHYSKINKEDTMDIREKKTVRNITNAFLDIRTNKPLERITVKELCERAEISKATFYLHYRDIYDLSDTLQLEVIKKIIMYVSDPSDMIYKPLKSSHELINGFYANRSIINILFSGSQFSVLPEKIETQIKELIFGKYPELENNVYANVRITYQLMGSFYSFYKYENTFGFDGVMNSVDRITELFSTTMPEEKGE